MHSASPSWQCLWISAISVFLVLLPDPNASAASSTSLATGDSELVISQEGAEQFRFGLAAWGPNWSWAGLKGGTSPQDSQAVGSFAVTLGSVPVRLDYRAGRPAPDRLELNYEAKAERDAQLTLLVIQIEPGEGFQGRDLVVGSKNNSSAVRSPFGKRPIGEAVDVLTWTSAAGEVTRMRFDPPCQISADGALRVVLASGALPANKVRRQKITVELPTTTQWYADPAELPDEPGIASWYPWGATGKATNSLVSLADWLEKPAGKHGRIQSQGSDLLYDGKPIKLWGLNLCYSACAPEKSVADARAAFYPRYGINAVRLHKFADGAGWNGIQSQDSAAEYDAAGLDRMDYQVAKFKEAGIFVKLSAHFGTIKLGPADRRDVPFLEEFGSFDGKRNDRVSAPHSAFFYSPELQNLHIRQIVNLLRHTNTYTGLRYAEDPAVFAVEIINEQSVLFFTSMAPLKQSATLRRQVGQRFSGWLKKKYGSQDGLSKAWGPRGLDGFEKDGFPAGESLDKENILPLGSPWYWDPEQLNGAQAFRKQRLLDSLQFLYELQCEAYDRYVAAVRKAGYTGEILGSNWQAGRAYSHFANLHSDSRVGLIDRHNYFGGGGRGTGKFNDASMLARPGSGSLSSGLQQVEDRPFMLSEWIHVFPNEWGAEGPAIIGAYGMGLQGWDVSFMFQNGDQAAFSPQLGGSSWDVMAPQVLAVFPAVARQVLRGDVRQSEIIARVNVHVPSLFSGQLGFTDVVKQGYDDKELDSTAVPARALAAVRCAVRFTPQPEPTPTFDLQTFREGDFLVSAGKQLRWKQGSGRADGFFTINAEGTRAVAGFARDVPCRLGDITVTPRSPFAVIYVSAPGRQDRIANARRLIVTALARARNTGMKFGVAGDELLERGKGPVLMEPVKADIALAGRRISGVQVLDHDGCPTGKTVPVDSGRFTIDGARDRTAYYEITLE